MFSINFCSFRKWGRSSRRAELGTKWDSQYHLHDGQPIVNTNQTVWLQKWEKEMKRRETKSMVWTGIQLQDMVYINFDLDSLVAWWIYVICFIFLTPSLSRSLKTDFGCTGNTPPKATKENVIFQLLEMIIQFWNKFLEDLENRFYLFYTNKFCPEKITFME